MTAWRPVRAAVVGAGLMGRWHAHTIPTAGGVVVSVVDQDLRRAEALAARCAQANAATDLSAIASRELIDVVHLCTPLEYHVPLARQALEAGLDVLIEKPLAETARDTAQLLSLAGALGRLVCPVHQFLFQPGIERGLRQVSRLAPVLHVDALACSAGAVGSFASAPDKLIGEIIPHPLALLARLFPGGLPATSWQIEHPREGELRASGCVQGASFTLLVSANGRPTANTLRVIGAQGSLEADLFHGFAIVESGAVSRRYKIARPFVRSTKTLLTAGLNLAARAARGETAYPGLRALIHHFYRAVRGAAAPPISSSEILEVAAARDALLAVLDAEVRGSIRNVPGSGATLRRPEQGSTE